MTYITKLYEYFLKAVKSEEVANLLRRTRCKFKVFQNRSKTLRTVIVTERKSYRITSTEVVFILV